MAKLTQKKLIEQLGELKTIKPNKEWVILLKSQILSPTAEVLAEKKSSAKANFAGFFNGIFHRKALSAVVSLAVIIVGVFGFAIHTVPGDLLFPIKKIAEQSQAALTGQTGLSQSMATLNSRINDLALVAKEGRKDNIPSVISEISANASQVVKDLKDNQSKNQQAIKDIANSLRVLADVPGTDLTANQDVKNLYEAVVTNQIEDLDNTTLTDEQQTSLEQIKELYDQGKYTEALEAILLINQ